MDNQFDNPLGSPPSDEAFEPLQPSHGDILFMPASSPPRPEAEYTPVERQIGADHAARHRSEEQLGKARRRQEVFLQKRREKKRRRVFYSRLKVLTRLLFSIILLVGLYFAAIQPYWHFPPNGFVVHGSRLIKPHHLAHYFEPLQDKPIYAIDPARLQKAIKAEWSLVEAVQVRRRLFPVGIDVIVSEKPIWGLLYPAPPRETSPTPSSDSDSKAASAKAVPVYLLHWDNTLTDLANFALDSRTMSAMHNAIPMVSPATRFEPKDLERYRTMAHLLNSRPDMARLRYVDVSNPYDIYAQFEGFRVRIGRADGTMIARLSRLFNVVSSIRQNQERIQMVDLRWNHQVLFKKKSPEQVAAEKQQAELQAKQTADETLYSNTTGAPIQPEGETPTRRVE